MQLSAPKTFPAILAVLVLGGLLGSCSVPPRQEFVCHELLGEGRFYKVLEICPDPYQRVSAYLGLAGFDFFDFALAAGEVTDLVGVLGLTPENITAKRNLIVQAAEEVREPHGGDEAFALLISAFLGLSITVSEYLDNGAAESEALDGAIDDDESDAATGLETQPPIVLAISKNHLPLALTPAGSPENPLKHAYFTVGSQNSRFILNCEQDLSEPYCDNDTAGTALLYADETGAGVLDTANPPDIAEESAAVLATLNLADPVEYVVQILALQLPFVLTTEQSDDLSSFLGQGSAQGRFPIGILGYLDLLAEADHALAVNNGVESSSSTISEEISVLRNQLDNGAGCVDETERFSAVGDLLDSLYFLYAKSTGTRTAPAATDEPGTYFDLNTDDTELFSGLGTLLPALPDPATYVFATPFTYRFIFATEAELLAFDGSKATARIDQTPEAFQNEFNSIPVFAPVASLTGDGEVGVMELLCYDQ